VFVGKNASFDTKLKASLAHCRRQKRGDNALSTTLTAEYFLDEFQIHRHRQQSAFNSVDYEKTSPFSQQQMLNRCRQLHAGQLQQGSRLSAPRRRLLPLHLYTRL